jgi:hypothetical protein
MSPGTQRLKNFSTVGAMSMIDGPAVVVFTGRLEINTPAVVA